MLFQILVQTVGGPSKLRAACEHVIMYTIKTSESCLVSVVFGREFPGIDPPFTSLMCHMRDDNYRGGALQECFFTPIEYCDDVL